MTSTASPKSSRQTRRDLPVWGLGDGPRPTGPFVALVPGEAAPLLRVSVPDGLTGRARDDVARRQICDRTGLSPAQANIRPAPLGQAPAWSRVVMAGRADLAGWKAALGDAAGACRAILPDYLDLPARDGLWVIDHRAGRVRARLGVADGFSAEPALAAEMLRIAAQDPSTVPRAVLALGTDWPALSALVTTLRGTPELLRTETALPADLRAARFAHGELALDLGQEPARQAEGLRRALRRILVPLCLAACGAGAWVGGQVLDTRADLAAAREMRTHTRQAATRDLLGTVPILDLRAQVTQALEAARSQSPDATAALAGLEIVHRAALALANAGVLSDGAAPQSVRQIAFGDDRRGVRLDVRLPSFQHLDAVQDALRAQGLALALERTGRTEDGGVDAVLVLTDGETP